MPYLRAATPDQGTVRPDERLAEEFWQIVCADDDWLRAEFDAIVADCDPGMTGIQGLRPPVPRRPVPPARDARPVGRERRPACLAAPGRVSARQRSPPPVGQVGGGVATGVRG
ncbi:hypothetical protein [Ornithinimicrobium avium]|nr:hypothetical protein [Ornithinimicrobium avium]